MFNHPFWRAAPGPSSTKEGQNPGKKFLGTILILGLVLLPIPLFSTDAEGPIVVINELMWMGSSVSAADEWIELRNLTDQTVDLTGWRLTKKSSGAETTMLTIPAGKSIESHGFFLIANYPDSSSGSALNIGPNLVDTDVALVNSALQIKLYDAAGNLIDLADDGVGNPLSGQYDSTGKIFASMERLAVPGDGASAQNWHSATKSTGFDAGLTERGTPGGANSNSLPSASAGPDQTGLVGQELNFDGSDSIDPEGQPLTFVWDFVDGANSQEVTPKHAYGAAGAFTVTLTVNDGIDTATDTATVTIVEAPAAPPPPPPESVSPPPPAVPPVPDVPITPTSCQGLHLSEVYPNPPGVDTEEFIELVNNGDEEISTGACQVAVNVKTYQLPAETVVPVGGFLLLKKTDLRFTLNNTGLTLKLLDGDSRELDRTVYGAAPEGQSWTRFGGAWEWTLRPTANAVNILVKKEDVAPSGQADKKKGANTNQAKQPTGAGKKNAKKEAPAQVVSLADIQELDSGDKVVVRGVVTVPVGLLGANLTFIQNDGAGAAIVIPNGEPALAIGNEIEVTGTVRLSQGRRRVAAAAHGIKIMSTVEVAAPMLTTGEVGSDQADQLVQVKGVVALASGHSVEIDDGSGPLTVYLKSSTGIVRPKVKPGDTVEATGIVNVGTSGVRLWPRGQADVRVERVLGAATGAASPAMVIPPSSSSQSLWYWVMAGIGGVAAAIKPAWQAWKRRGEDKL